MVVLGISISRTKPVGSQMIPAFPGRTLYPISLAASATLLALLLVDHSAKSGSLLRAASQPDASNPPSAGRGLSVAIRALREPDAAGRRSTDGLAGSRRLRAYRASRTPQIPKQEHVSIDTGPWKSPTAGATAGSRIGEKEQTGAEVFAGWQLASATARTRLDRVSRRTRLDPGCPTPP